jgi:mono/diheme cytochrome c family protein
VAPTAPAAPSAEAAPSAAAKAEPLDDGLGGRLIDRFYDKETFAPDDKKTRGLADGKGGPFGNGTLALVDGKVLLNDGGHDYRLKNFFGWDLRGADGIYGPKYQNKKDVQPFSLLASTKSPAEITALLSKGEGTLPGYGSVLSAADIDAIVGFVSAVREGRLPGPERIWALSEGTPGNYKLNAGADPERGKKLIADRCSGCHGDDGTDMLFDGGEYSLGTHARQKAYEDWFKILNGQPGTKMKRFVEGDAQTMGAEILDILAALCDTKAFPKGKATGTDVAPGDPRCGSYLK